jgi:hypothetical protein
MEKTRKLKPCRDNLKCIDCDIDTFKIKEYYMLFDMVWRIAVPEDKGMLCIGCVEERLGRKLSPEDFSICPLNEEGYPQPRSDRMKDRMGFTNTSAINTDIEERIKYVMGRL